MTTRGIELISEDGAKGKFYRATKDIQPGTVLIREEAVTSIVDPKFAAQICSLCWSPPEEKATLKRCSRCQYCRYCSTECQKKHWVKGHKEECNLMHAVKPQVPTRSILYLARLLQKMQLLEKTGSSLEENALLQSVLDLCDHKDDMSTDEKLSYGYVSRMTHLFLNGKLPAPSVEGEIDEMGEPSDLDETLEVPPETLDDLKGPGPSLIFSLLHKLSINSFNISDGEVVQGVGLFVKSARINHDCDPNCAVSFIFPDPSSRRANNLAILRGSGDSSGSNGPLELFVEVKALRPIKEGEVISISYVDRLLPSTQRRLILSQSFFFHCDCSLCSDPIKSSSYDLLLTGYKSREQGVAGDSKTGRLP
eukprot:TRINITY_DN4564_c0_g1_i1.p1 TRINITY_DN4564_c0_g1~~TRINITY_DN4564_c0_g1_i1.p1  ORF type:complete len:372 (-),score=130.32 TRINITY_DN4564_c0_g1_i1:16-1110(-)